ncbi:MAG: DUF971 domain-containing protein [Planctomycetota bacterium]
MSGDGAPERSGDGSSGESGVGAVWPVHLDLKRDTALTVRWSDGRVSVYPVLYLRRQSPSAEARQEREAIDAGPLAVLKDRGGAASLRAESMELVGNYALRVRFSDGHDTGLYTWGYLREIDPSRPEAGLAGGSEADEPGSTGPR